LVFIEDAERVFAGSLRITESRIRLSQQSIGPVASYVFCNTNTDSRRSQISERLQNVAGRHAFAAAKYKVRTSYAPVKNPADLDKHLIPDRVAVCIIDFLEIVHVDHQQRERRNYENFKKLHLSDIPTICPSGSDVRKHWGVTCE
jgi:hypothetical protein